MFTQSINAIRNLIEIHPALPAVLELDGFLNAVRCIIDCPRRLFSAVMINGSISEDLQALKKNGSFSEISPMAWDQTYEQFIDHIYRRISDEKSRALDNLDWNLVEYFGLISTADEKDGPWNRLISQSHRAIEYTDEEGCESIIFYVEYSDFVVSVQLGRNWARIET